MFFPPARKSHRGGRAACKDAARPAQPHVRAPRVIGGLPPPPRPPLPVPCAEGAFNRDGIHTPVAFKGWGDRGGAGGGSPALGAGDFRPPLSCPWQNGHGKRPDGRARAVIALPS